MEQDFEASWKEHYIKSGDRRNGIVAIIALITGTILILPDVLLTPDYPLHLLHVRIGASVIGFLGYLLFKLKKIGNGTMVLFYALPVFIVTPYMVAILKDLTAVTQQNNTLAVVGIFFIAMFVLRTYEWIIICLVLYLSYFIILFNFGAFPFADYLSHGGSLVLIGFFTFPIITTMKYRLMRENYKLNFEVQCQKEELEYYANNDILTGAFNRRGGMKILEQSIRMTQRHEIPLSICFIDINGLKQVNDRQGHDVGDIMIKTIARLFRENIRKSDSIFRFGGDEFITIFPGCSLDDSQAILDKVLYAVSTFKSEETKEIPLAFSHGLAQYRENMSVEDLIKAADKEMYKDKK